MISDQSEESQMQVDEPDPVQMEINQAELGKVTVQLNKMTVRYRQLKAENKKEQERKREESQHT